MKRWVRTPSPALVISLIALFVALGGTAYAATTLPKNSVGTRQLKSNAVNSSKVKNHSLLAADFRPGQLPRGKTGAQGPAGPQGAQGQAGPQGNPGVSGYTQVDAFSAFDTTTPKTAEADCPAGTKIIGGGAYANVGGGVTGPVALAASLPISDGRGWIGTAYRTDSVFTGSWNIDARAICAIVAP